jgi:HEPN domain-containing protein
LNSFDILDTDPEIEMDEIAEMAKALFGAPISVVSFIDGKRQWYKSKIGVEWSEVLIEDTFCKYTLDKPDEILLIIEPEKDPRVASNPYVLGEDGIKFYVSAPVVSSKGNVLGTVCVWDQKKHEVDESQLQALKILAKRVMISLETRKLLRKQKINIELAGERLKKLTDFAPGALFKFKADPAKKKLEVDFLSDGIKRLIPGVSKSKIKNNPKELIEKIRPPYRTRFLRNFLDSNDKSTAFELDIPIEVEKNKTEWFWVKARPEKSGSSIEWYGTIQEIDQKTAHVESLKNMLFDISHKMRAPLAKIKGIVSIIKDDYPKTDNSNELLNYLQDGTEELDDCLRSLNNEYQKKMVKLTKNK